jgi:hypothetical protein
MVRDALPPTFIGDSVVDTSRPGVALRFECVSPHAAQRVSRVACPHVYRVCRVAEMIDPRVLPRLMRFNAGRERESKPRCSEGVRRCFERHGWMTKRQPEEAAQRTAERVARQPDVGVWVERCDIAVEIERCAVVLVLGHDLLDKTVGVALVGSCGATADLMPEVVALLGTAAREEEVVVYFVGG